MQPVRRSTTAPATTGAPKFTKHLPAGLVKQRPVPHEPTSRAGELDTAPLQAAGKPKALALWDDLKEQATLAYGSGLLPRSVDSREKAITIALMGRELGLSPMQSLCGIYVVNGMTALRGSLMLRLIYERVPGARITVLTPPERAQVECAVEMQRPGNKPHVFKYTIEDARKAGFLGKPIWQQHTGTMLRWSAIRTGARIVFADAIAGCYMEDEIPGANAAASAIESPILPHETQLAQAQAMAEADRAGHAAPSAERAPVADPPAAVVETAPVVIVAKALPVEGQSPAPSGESAAPTPIEPPVGETRYAPPREMVSSLPRASRRVTEKQINRLFAIARAGNWPRQEIAKRMEDWFGKSEPHALNWAEYDKLCNFLLEKPRRSGAQSATAE